MRVHNSVNNAVIAVCLCRAPRRRRVVTFRDGERKVSLFIPRTINLNSDLSISHIFFFRSKKKDKDRNRDEEADSVRDHKKTRKKSEKVTFSSFTLVLI
jgi:hypothetical protein